MGAKVEIIPEAGHLPHEEQPARLADLVGVVFDRMNRITRME